MRKTALALTHAHKHRMEPSKSDDKSERRRKRIRGKYQACCVENYTLYDTENYFMLYIVKAERMCFTITRRYMHD